MREPVVAPAGGDVDPPEGRRRLGARLFWTTADQVLSSVTNAAVSFLVARQVGASAFGSFAVAFIAFAFASGTSRALVTDALLVRFSSARDEERRAATGDATGAVLLVAAVGAVLCVVAGLIAAGLTGSVLLAMAVVLPGLLLQGAWRQAFFAARRPAAACLNDLVWAVLQVGGILALGLAGGADAVTLVLVWGAAAAVAASFGAFQAGVRPQVRYGWSWLRAHRDIGARFATDFIISQGAANAAVILVGGIVGLAAVGSIRGAHVLLGPVHVLYFALTSFALPVLARRVTLGLSLRREAFLISAVASGLTLSWVVLLLVLPQDVGVELLGDSWVGARDVLALLGLQWAAVGVALGATLGLKAQARAGTLLRLTLIQAPVLLLLGCVGAGLGGAPGAVGGFALAQVLGASLNWIALVRSTRVSALVDTLRSGDEQ